MTVLLAGGGTGGHIYPNVAVLERLREREPQTTLHFLVSDREGDTEVMAGIDAPWSASPSRPLPNLRRPWEAAGFLWAWTRSVRHALGLLRRLEASAVVATGGFVSGPAVVAAARLSIPRVLVNLDAVPGRANRHLARLCTHVYSSYETDALPGAEHIGLPLRAAAISDKPRPEARRALGLDPQRPLVFITGATHGAQSLVDAVITLVGDSTRADALANWQILHQCGGLDPAELLRAYQAAGIRAEVVAYLGTMGLAWRAADVAISRAGANSVAEAWANATPTLFVPNPYHRDQHQRKNAEPLVAADGAILVTDHIDADRTAAGIAEALLPLLTNDARRTAMSEALRNSCPPDGATTIATWVQHSTES